MSSIEKKGDGWVPVGVSNFKPYQLSKDDTTWLQAELAEHKVDKFSGEKFVSLIKQLEHAISKYHSAANLKTQTAPAIVRENLTKLSGLLESLSVGFNDLDGASIHILSNEHLGGFVGAIDDIGTLSRSVEQAISVAEGYPKSGALLDHTRLFLAVDTIESLSEFLEEAPKISRDNVFESILSITLSIATGKDVSAVHALLAKAVKLSKRRETI